MKLIVSAMYSKAEAESWLATEPPPLPPQQEEQYTILDNKKLKIFKWNWIFKIETVLNTSDPSLWEANKVFV